VTTPSGCAASTARLEEQEMKFQLSFQTKMADDVLGRNGDVWFS
jgi:outer membrane phospholipase A